MATYMPLPQEQPHGPIGLPVDSRLLRRQRLRISNACLTCRLSKAKCDGTRPVCSRCQGRGKPCSYSQRTMDHHVPVEPPKKRKLLIATKPSEPALMPVAAPPPAAIPRSYSPPEPSSVSTTTSASTAASTSASASIPTPSTAASSSTPPEHLDHDQQAQSDSEQSREYYTAHGRFAGQVADAIDVKSGFTPAANSHPVPFVDAPLFGDLDLQFPYRVRSTGTELPPRSYADRLVGIYWKHVDPIESVLDRERFFHDYEATYSRSGMPLYADRDVWYSILYSVFAMAVQRQESSPQRKRDEEGNYFFQCAWAYLSPETILWKPGSIELVQCLMLFNRYLHCTDHLQKTWMTAGLAIRIAQSLNCHIPDPSPPHDSGDITRLKQRVWASCLALDRCVTWSLGRTSASSLFPLPTCLDPHAPANVHTWFLELQEIGNQIQLAQTQTRNPLAARLGLPRLYQSDEYHAVAVQLDSALQQWEARLPRDWQLANVRTAAVSPVERAQRYLLHLRALHSRIFLYRPMLARYYLMRTQPLASAMNSSASTAPSTASPSSHPSISALCTPPPAPPSFPPSTSLSDRLVKECAALCIEAAQRVTALILETLEFSETWEDEDMVDERGRRLTHGSGLGPATVGLIPWWNRIYYLHIAGTNFLAAMFGPPSSASSSSSSSSSSTSSSPSSLDNLSGGPPEDPGLFTPAVAASWDRVMASLRAHEVYTPYVSECVRTFDTLRARIVAATTAPAPSRGGAHAMETGMSGVGGGMGCETGQPMGQPAIVGEGFMEGMVPGWGGAEGCEFGYEHLFQDFDGMLFGWEEGLDYGNWR